MTGWVLAPLDPFIYAIHGFQCGFFTANPWVSMTTFLFTKVIDWILFRGWITSVPDLNVFMLWDTLVALLATLAGYALQRWGLKSRAWIHLDGLDQMNLLFMGTMAATIVPCTVFQWLTSTFNVFWGLLACTFGFICVYLGSYALARSIVYTRSKHNDTNGYNHGVGIPHIFPGVGAVTGSYFTLFLPIVLLHIPQIFRYWSFLGTYEALIAQSIGIVLVSIWCIYVVFGYKTKPQTGTENVKQQQAVAAQSDDEY
jgi:hypothetical protein